MIEERCYPKDKDSDILCVTFGREAFDVILERVDLSQNNSISSFYVQTIITSNIECR